MAKKITTIVLVVVAGMSWLTPPTAEAGIIVRFETSHGNFDVDLYDDTTPLTVANFLQYVDDGDYDGTIIHRSIPGFVIQGGGFSANNTFPPDEIMSRDPVLNEPVHSNVRGTIAMAKIGPPPGQQPTETTINSATNQWFFNLADNSANLDNQNGGFTAFGEVLGDGMDVIDAIAGIDFFNGGGAFGNLPLDNFDNTALPTNEHYVIIHSISRATSEIPEPASLSILALGALALTGRRAGRTA